MRGVSAYICSGVDSIDSNFNVPKVIKDLWKEVLNKDAGNFGLVLHCDTPKFYKKWLTPALFMAVKLAFANLKGEIPSSEVSILKYNIKWPFIYKYPVFKGLNYVDFSRGKLEIERSLVREDIRVIVGIKGDIDDKLFELLNTEPLEIFIKVKRGEIVKIETNSYYISLVKFEELINHIETLISKGFKSSEIIVSSVDNIGIRVYSARD